MALCWNRNENRPIPQRAKKRINKQQRKANRELIEGQQTISVNTQGAWNMQEKREEMKEKFKQEFWGDRLKSKGDGDIRIATKNIQGLGLTPGNSKEDELKEWMVNRDLDIVGLQELNVNWNKCKHKARFCERFRSPAWEYIRDSVAHNKHDRKHRHYYGGCATIGINQVTHRVAGSGADERGLGRWSWLLLKGKNNRTVRIVTTYQPHINKNALQPGTAYSQHRQHLLQQGIETCPVELYREELLNQLKTWIRMKKNCFPDRC